MESGSAGSHSECYTAPHFAGLASPAIAERLRRLEKSGVIRSFTVDVDPQALGYTLKAIVRIKPFPGKMHILEKLLQSTPEICECDKAETNTSIVKSQPVRRRTPPLTVKSSGKN